MSQNLTELKKHIFYELLNMAGRVFVLVRYSDDIIIGERGFLSEEKEKGLVLVFNSKMSFVWNDRGISAALGFGAKTEKCFIPPDSIISIFSPELNAQFSVSPDAQGIVQHKEEKIKGHSPAREKVVKIDFSKKNSCRCVGLEKISVWRYARG